jgi:hypothetical protein
VARDDKWNVVGKWHMVRAGVEYWDDEESGYSAPEGI